MEITVIALSILLGLAIAGLGAIVIVQMIIGSKDRGELEKLLKARSLQEYSYYAPKDMGEEEEEEEDNLVNLEDIAEHLG